jgi:asparagine synthase (glutamine-hydrolysing)
MCGINGCIDKTGQRDLVKILGKMNRQIRHRGPDDKGVWTENKLGMGMQRLSIIDLKTGSQPMHNSFNNTTIVFNGEIYNYRSLKKDLEASGQQFKTSSDTEVILKLFQVYGTDAFGMLDGMFALSIFDPDQKKVYCARDFFGEKPLYYFADDKTIGWASELKSLILLKDQKPSIDSTALSLYFRLTYIPAPFTIFSGIYKLEPNHYLTINTESYTIEKHLIVQNIKPQKFETKEQAIRHTHDKVMESVRSRSVSDVPLASFLSGGVDSSVISFCLAQFQAQPIDTFSIGFENPLFDESENAAIVAKNIGSKHHNFICSEKDIFSISEKVILNFDEPYADSSALASHWVANQTSKSFKVALTGDGG